MVNGKNVMVNGKNVMVDLETVSLASNPAIVAIGAVSFDAEGIKKEFYQNVDLQSCIDLGLKVDGNTVYWWLEQSEEARKALLIGRTNIHHALWKLSMWITDNTGPSFNGIWANGAAEDLVWLVNAYKAASMAYPWRYKQHRCYRTIKELFPGVEIPDVGTAHNALDDAKYQALKLIEINRRYQNGLRDE